MTEESWGEVGIVLPGDSDRARGNDFKVHQEGFGLDIRENFLERMVSYWNRLPKKVVKVKKRVDVALRDMIQGAWWERVSRWTR